MARRRSAEQWRELVAAWRASGLTAARFAATRKIKASTLSWWAWKLRGEAASTIAEGSGSVAVAKAPPAFVEVVTATAAPSRSGSDAGISLRAGDFEVRIERGFDADTLRRLLDALGLDAGRC